MKKFWTILTLLIIILLIFLPKIASLPIFKPFFEKKLEEKTQADIRIGSMRFSWLGPQEFRDITFKKSGVEGSAKEFQIIAPFWSFSGPFEMKEGEISYNQGELKNIEAKVEGEDFTLSADQLKGHFHIQGKIESELKFHIQIDIKEFPLIIINQKIDEILGPTLDLFGTVQMNGSDGKIDLNIRSQNLKTHLIAKLASTGIYLDHPLELDITLTPSLSTLLLKDANPLLLTSISSDTPIKILLFSEGFFFPYPFDIAKLQVPKARLDLGKVRCKNGKTLNSIVQLFQTGPLAPHHEMQVWFSPLDFQIVNGNLKADRMDALIDGSIHIATWGKINLVKDKIDMTLGIPEDTLRKSFGITNLPKDYVLQIDIKGKTNDPKINKAAAATKIAALIAASQTPKKGVIGGIINLFSGESQKDVPPAKRPFPWER